MRCYIFFFLLVSVAFKTIFASEYYENRPFNYKLLMTIMRSYIEYPEFDVEIDKTIFDPVLNSNELLSIIFQTDPNLFIGAFNRIRNETYKEILPILLKKLMIMFPENEAIKLELFKIGNVKFESELEGFLKFINGIEDEDLNIEALRSYFVIPR